MEKLQPFIKYHFWLLFLPAFSMPPLAWWMTTSSLQGTIDERTAALDGAFSSIPSGVDTANSDWIDKADAQIGIRTETNVRTSNRLWDWQKTLVKWPPNVAKYMDSCEYRGEITDPAISRRVPIDYRRDYPREVRRVWLLADPMGHAADPIPPKAPKKVYFPLDNMPQVSPEKWRNLPPSFIEIWNSQEDLWLLEEILLAIQRTNSSSTSITDSFVRQIQEVALFGGERVKPGDVPSSGSSTPGTSGEPGASSSTPIGFPSSMGRRSGRQTPTSARFNLAEEFKAKGLASKSRTSSMGIMPSAEATGEGGGNSGAPAGDDLNVDENRYITVADAYRTRGFQLVVTVHQQYVPDLVKELLNSQYPISITRMEQAALHPDEPDGSSTDSRSGPSIASSRPGGAGFDASTYSDPTGGAPPDYPESGGVTGEGGDPFEDSSDGGSTTSAPVTNEAASAALEELDLVEVMIVGELYLYNPPPTLEGGEGAADTGSDPATGVPAEDPTLTTPEPVTPVPTTPEPATPAPTTPEPASPVPTTPAPGTPATPVPEKPAS